MGEVLGEQTVILEDLSQNMVSLPRWEQLETVSRETAALRALLEQEQTDMAEIRQLLEQERQREEQDGKKREKRFSICFPKISLPLILAALWAAWYDWGVLWNTFSPMFT